MVYSNKFVLCLLVNGRVQKDRKNGTVELPFGTEYALRLRNKHNRRALAKIFIDGENVSGPGYIIGARDFVDIQRHHDKDRAFKFVDLDSEEAYDAGKNGPNEDKEKGLIEVRFHLEKERDWDYHQPVTPIPMPRPRPPYRDPYEPWIKPLWHGDITSTGSTEGDSYKHSMGAQNMSLGDQPASHMDCSLSASAGGVKRGKSPKKIRAARHNAPSKRDLAKQAARSMESLEDGCTVEGNQTGQSFREVYFEEERDYVTCTLYLQGYHSDDPVYVHEQKTDARYCDNCGAKKSKKKAKFCSNCGTKF